MFSSIWNVILLYLLYYGSNAQSFAIFKDMDDDSFYQAISFSFLDAGMECALFILFHVIISYTTGINSMTIFHAYLYGQNYSNFLLHLSMFVPFCTLVFFWDFMGIDPMFQFDWINNKTVINATISFIL